MWQREFIITNTLDHKMIYSAVSLLFSLTVNGFDLAEISMACSSSPSISLAWSLSSFISDLFTLEWSKEWKYVGADNLEKKIIILLFSEYKTPLYRFLGNYIHPELSFNFILDPGLIVAGLIVVLSPR